MKRLIAVLSGLLVLPAFAEVAPVFYEEAIEYADEMYDAYDDVDAQQIQEEEAKSAPAPVATTQVSPRTTTGRAASRAVASNATTTPTRGTTTRTNTATRTTTSTQTRSAVPATTATASRSVSARTSRAAASNSTATTSPRVSARRTDATPTNATTARASIIQSDTVNTPLYTGRVGVRTSSTVTSRMPTIQATASTTTTTDTSTISMDELAQITDFCKAQYTSCMDNFCNVLDDNQGRCSCSANLKNYSKTEDALKQATEDLQDAAQKIQYIGLTADEIETLFTQTEAELKMQNTTDNTQLKNDLDKIKNMIVDVKSGTATTTDTGISLDLTGLLDFTISSTGFDLSSLFGNTTSTASISNQRGEQLYKTATARCKASVLNSCQAQGVDISIITNAYDLEIDKQCIAYERSLSDANDQMASTVRNAKSVLQKARLMVAQQKNAYDLRGCVNALDTCMQDDFVCGSDYENCLDPSGKYIVNGEVVVGSTPGVSGGELDTTSGAKSSGLYSTWDYTSANAWGKDGQLDKYIETYVTSTFPTSNMDKMANYLQQKIGKITSDGKAEGMCASVLNKCQDYTFTLSNGKTYNPANEVIKSYLERTLVQIKSAQDEVLADYAESCISDVASCLSQNNYYNNYYGSTTTTTTSNPSEVSIKACMSVINTCKSVNERNAETKSVYEWLNAALGTTLK